MPVDALPNEKELLLLLSEDDHDAFVTLFLHYQDHIHKVAWQFVKSREVSEELVQDIFIKVWEKRKELVLIAQFRNWLFIVARNYILNYLRKMANEDKARKTWLYETPEYEQSADYKLRKSQFAKTVQQIINSLPPQQQTVYRLAREEYLSYDEIAKRLSLSPNTIRNHMVKALQTIKLELKNMGISFILFLALQNPGL